MSDPDRIMRALQAADAASSDPSASEEDRASAANDARQLAAMYRSETAQAAQQADSQTAPEQPGILDQLRKSLSKSYVDNMTGAKAAAQGIPGIGTWTDELAGQIMSRLHGGTPEENRKAYMAPVEAMPAWRRTAAELVGGAAGGVGLAAAAPSLVGFVPGVLAGTALGAAQGAGANQENRIGGAESGAVAGGLMGMIGPVVTSALAKGGARIGSKIGELIGKPANPFLGKGGANAQEALRDSINLAVKRGEPAANTASPLLAQPAGVTAAKRVLAMGGDPSAELSRAAKGVIENRDALRAVGDRYQTDLGLAKMTTTTKPSDLINAPSLQSPVFDHLSDYPDVKKILRTMSSDPRFEGVPLDNANVRHYVKTMLSETAAALKKSGKKPAIAGRVQSVHDAWANEMDKTLPGYADVSSAYRDAAQKYAANADIAKLTGGTAKFTPQESTAIPITERAAESVSGSIPGAMTRASFNLAAALAERLGLSSRKQTMAKISSILAETDPAKIEMAIKMLNKDMTGKGMRPLLTMQGDNLARAAARR